MDDTISRRQAIYVCLELMHERRKWLSDAGQKEINGIDAAMCAIQDLPSAQPCNQLATDCISRQAAINAVAEGLKHTFVENQDIAEKLIGKLPSAQPERTCVNCGRTANNGGWYADGGTRCPIEEHYALPKDGYCHLWEKRNVTDDDYPERRTDE